MEYEIEITSLALELLSKIKNRKEQEGLSKRIEQLKLEPEKQGKALSGVLKGYRSVRALEQRYRIVDFLHES
jgi:mRNA interferase RelE/StbE